MVFHWSLSDSKSPQVSGTRLRILAVLSNAVVWIVSVRPPISKSSRPFNNFLVIVPNAPITTGTIVTFMFHRFFDSLARSRYLSFVSLSFRFILWSAGTAKSTILQIIIIIIIQCSLYQVKVLNRWIIHSDSRRTSLTCYTLRDLEIIGNVVMTKFEMQLKKQIFFRFKNFCLQNYMFYIFMKVKRITDDHFVVGK